MDLVRAVVRPLLPPLLAAAIASPVLAARPLATDDAGVTGVGECQVDAFAAHAQSRGERGVASLSLQGNCGAWDGTALGAGYTRDRDGDADPQLWSLGGKTALGEPVDEAPAYALSWGLGGRRVLGQSWRFDGVQATLVTSLPLGAGWTMHGNVGWARAHATRRSTTSLAVAAEHQRRRDGLRLGLEVFGNDRDPGLWLQAGAALPVGAGWQLNASLGTLAHPLRTRQLTLGATRDF